MNEQRGENVQVASEPIPDRPETERFAPCPRCSATDARQVGFTWWGSLLGAAILHHVECRSCRARYNGKTGRSNTPAIAGYCLLVNLIVVKVLQHLWQVLF